MPIPVVPYMMNSPYGYGYYGRRRSMNHIAHPLSPYWGRQLNRESQQDAYRSLQMYGNRTKNYNEFLRRWETQLTDMRTVTVERKDGRIRRYVHTPYIMSERYFTELEHKLRIAKIVSISFLVTLVLISVFIAVILSNSA